MTASSWATSRKAPRPRLGAFELSVISVLKSAFADSPASARSYALTNGESFVAQAAHSTYDIAGHGDTEGTPAELLAQRASTLKWDRKSKKFVRADQVGADNKKLIRGESGQRLPASFKSGVFDEWRKNTRISVPRVGDQEIKGRTVQGGKRFRHQGAAPNESSEGGASGGKGKAAKRRVGKAGKPGSAPGGLKTAAEIRKERIAKEKRVRRSNQPSKKNPKGKAGPASGSMGGGGGGRRK